MSSRCQSRQLVYQAACHLGAGTSSGAKRLRGVGGVVWVVVARSEGRRGAADAAGMGLRGGSYRKEWLLCGTGRREGENGQNFLGSLLSSR